MARGRRGAWTCERGDERLLDVQELEPALLDPNASSHRAPSEDGERRGNPHGRGPVTLADVTTGGFGGALFLIALGAILRYAVSWEAAGVDIGIVGLILMIVGVVMLLLTLFLMFSARRPPGTPPPPY